MFEKHCPTLLSKSNSKVYRIQNSTEKLKTKVDLRLGPLSELNWTDV